jgi:hypothetical protein
MRTNPFYDAWLFLIGDPWGSLQGHPRIGKALPAQLHRGTAELEILQGALGSSGRYISCMRRRRQCISPIKPRANL